MDAASVHDLKLASFDGGGPRGFSQLMIMKRFMHQLKWRIHRDDQSKILLPCDYFDMIGGSDTGGLIAIMFAKLRMSVEDAIQEFGTIIDDVYAKGLEPAERTRKMRICIETLLKKRGFPVDLRLEEQRQGRRCLGFVVSASNLSVVDKVCFRTYFVPNDPPSNITVVDAIMATCASPSQFLPVAVGIGHERRSYVGGCMGTNNPIRHVITEAYANFDEGSSLALLLSIGAGHPGVLSFDFDNNDTGLHDLLLEMMQDSEEEASKLQKPMEDTRAYFRFSVLHGLQKVDRRVDNCKWILAQTEAYLKDRDIAHRLERCVHQAYLGHSMLRLKRLNHTCGLAPDITVHTHRRDRSPAEDDTRRYCRHLSSASKLSLVWANDDVIHQTEPYDQSGSEDEALTLLCLNGFDAVRRRASTRSKQSQSYSHDVVQSAPHHLHSSHSYVMRSEKHAETLPRTPLLSHMPEKRLDFPPHDPTSKFRELQKVPDLVRRFSSRGNLSRVKAKPNAVATALCLGIGTAQGPILRRS